MDHALKSLLEDLAKKLLTPSRAMEGGRGNAQDATFYRQSIHTLASDPTLENLTRSSISIPNPLAPPNPKSAVSLPTPSPVAVTAAAVKSAQVPHKPLVATSSRSEYQGALKDQSVVEALLLLAKNQKAAPVEPTRGGSAGFSQANPPRISEPQSFSPADVPQIEAEPKRGAYMKRSPGIAQTILRPRSS